MNGGTGNDSLSGHSDFDADGQVELGGAGSDNLSGGNATDLLAGGSQPVGGVDKCDGGRVDSPADTIIQCELVRQDESF